MSASHGRTAASGVPITKQGNGPWEAMIHDAELPTMTARFRIPDGLPFASGMYELRWVRTPTKEDHQRWAHLPEPEEHAPERMLPERAGICAWDLDECTVTIALDSADEVRTALANLPARSRVRITHD